MNERSFDSALRKGRHEAFHFGVPALARRDGRLLSLDELTRVVKPEGESWLGVVQVAVACIVGSEGRANDFSRSFLPLSDSLEARWTTVRDLFLAGSIAQAIRVCEYGGGYFVRDGNHRVSVAKTHGVEFMDAEVTRLVIPVRLPAEMSHGKIPVLAAKLQVRLQTRIFDSVPEERLGDGNLRSWSILQALWAREYGEETLEGDQAVARTEQLVTEFRILHDTVRALIRRQALHLLFPEKSELDIFADVMALWMRLGREATPVEALIRLVRTTERRRGILSFGHVVSRTRRWLLSTDAEERRLFLQVSRLQSIRPGVALHEGDKRWYTFLARQLMRWHPNELRKRLGRPPFQDELVTSWYDGLYAPAAELYEEQGFSVPFPTFYTRWMTWRRRRRREALLPTREDLAANLQAYVSTRKRGRFMLARQVRRPL